MSRFARFLCVDLRFLKLGLRSISCPGGHGKHGGHDGQGGYCEYGVLGIHSGYCGNDIQDVCSPLKITPRRVSTCMRHIGSEGSEPLRARGVYNFGHLSP